MTPRSPATCAWSVTMSRAPESCRIQATSLGWSLALTGTTASPAHHAAKRISRYSRRLSMTTALQDRRPVAPVMRSRRDREAGRYSCRARDEVRLGRGTDLGFGDTWRTLHQPEAFVRDIQDGQVGDDAVDDALTGERQRALLDDLEVSVLGDVLHQDDDPSRTMDEVHGPAHALDHLAGDRPVGEVASGRDLHGAKNRGVDPAGADHPEARRRV